MSHHVYCPNPDPRTLLCLRCGRLCEPRVNGWQHARPRCGAWMRNAKTTCARRAGHGGGFGGAHRSSWAVEYDNERRRLAA